MLVLPLVVLTVLASCHATAKHEDLRDPVPQRIKPHGLRPTHPIQSVDDPKPTPNRLGPQEDDDPDPPSQNPSRLSRNQPEHRELKRATEPRNDQSNGSDLAKKLMLKMMRTRHRRKRQQAKVVRSAFKIASQSLKQRATRRAQDHLDNPKSRQAASHQNGSEEVNRPSKQLAPSHWLKRQSRDVIDLTQVLKEEWKVSVAVLNSTAFNLTWQRPEKLLYIKIEHKAVYRIGDKIIDVECSKNRIMTEECASPYLITELEPNQLFNIKMRVTYRTRDNNQRRTLDFALTGKTAPKSIKCVAESNSSSTIRVAWTDFMGNKRNVNYSVQYRQIKDHDYIQEPVISKETLCRRQHPNSERVTCEYILSGLSANQTYDVSVLGQNEGGTSRAIWVNARTATSEQTCFYLHGGCSKESCSEWSNNCPLEGVCRRDYSCDSEYGSHRCCPNYVPQASKSVCQFRFVTYPTMVIIKWYSGPYQRKDNTKYNIQYKDVTGPTASELSKQVTACTRSHLLNEQDCRYELSGLSPGRTYEITVFNPNQRCSKSGNDISDVWMKFTTPEEQRTVISQILRLNNILRTLIDADFHDPLSDTSTVAAQLKTENESVYSWDNLVALVKLAYDVPFYNVINHTERTLLHREKLNILSWNFTTGFIVDIAQYWARKSMINMLEDPKNRRAEYNKYASRGQLLLDDKFTYPVQNTFNKLGNILLRRIQMWEMANNLCTEPTDNRDRRGKVASRIVKLNQLLKKIKPSENWDKFQEKAKGLAETVRESTLSSFVYSLERMTDELKTVCNIPGRNVTEAIQFMNTTLLHKRSPIKPYSTVQLTRQIIANDPPEVVELLDQFIEWADNFIGSQDDDDSVESRPVTAFGGDGRTSNGDGVNEGGTDINPERDGSTSAPYSTFSTAIMQPDGNEGKEEYRTIPSDDKPTRSRSNNRITTDVRSVTSGVTEIVSSTIGTFLDCPYSETGLNWTRDVWRTWEEHPLQKTLSDLNKLITAPPLNEDLTKALTSITSQRSNNIVEVSILRTKLCGNPFDGVNEIERVMNNNTKPEVSLAIDFVKNCVYRYNRTLNVGKYKTHVNILQQIPRPINAIGGYVNIMVLLLYKALNESLSDTATNVPQPIDNATLAVIAAIKLNHTTTRLIDFQLNKISSVEHIAAGIKDDDVPIIRELATKYNPVPLIDSFINGLKGHAIDKRKGSVDLKMTKSLLNAIARKWPPNNNDEKSSKKGRNLVSGNGVTMINEIINSVVLSEPWKAIKAVETISSGINIAITNKGFEKIESELSEPNREKIRNKTIAILSFGRNVTKSTPTQQNTDDAGEYIDALFNKLGTAFFRTQTGHVFDLLKKISHDDGVKNKVATMLHNKPGYDVDNFARETATNLIESGSDLRQLLRLVGNSSVKMPSAEVSNAVKEAEEALQRKIKETKVTDPLKLGIRTTTGNGVDNDLFNLIVSVENALPKDGSGAAKPTDNTLIDRVMIKELFKSFILVGSGKQDTDTSLDEFVDGLIDGAVSNKSLKHHLLMMQSFVDNTGLTPSVAGEMAARNDYIGNDGKNVLGLFKAITKVANERRPVEEEISDEKIKEKILNHKVKNGKVTPSKVADKLGNDSEIIDAVKKLLPRLEFGDGPPAIDLTEARQCVKVLFERLKAKFEDKFGGILWESALMIANRSGDLVEHIGRLQRERQSRDCGNITSSMTPEASKTFLNRMKKKMLDSFPVANPKDKTNLKEKFEKMFKELKKYADKQTDKNYTTFGETFGKGQGKQADKALQAIVDSMKLKLSRRRKRVPTTQSIAAMNGFVGAILGLIGLDSPGNLNNLKKLLNGIAHGAPTQAGATGLNTQAGTGTAPGTQGSNGANKDVGINSGQNSGNMADALTEGLSNMNAGDAEDDDDEDSLWWIGLIIGILLLIIIIIVVILLLRRRKKEEEPVEPEIEVVAVADMVSETMSTYGAEIPVVVVTSVVTTTTTHFQPGDPETEPTQASEDVITGVGGDQQVININVIHVNQDKDESSTDDIDSAADGQTDGHMLTDTEQSEVLYNADGTKQEAKEKKEKKRIKKSEKKRKLEEKQNKLDENKDQGEHKKADEEKDKDTQPQIIIIHEGQQKSGEKEIKNENDKEAKETEKSAKKDETGKIIIIHQYDGPKSKENDQIEKPKSQQDKDQIEKDDKKTKLEDDVDKNKNSNRESITKQTTKEQESQPKKVDDDNKVTRKESATKSAVNKADTSSKQKAEDDEKNTKRKESITANNPEGNQTANDQDKTTKRKESMTKSAAKPTENEKKSKRDGSKTQVSQKPGESKSQIGSVKKVNETDLLAKSKAKTDEQKSEKKQSEKSKFNPSDVNAIENKSKTQEMQREFKQSAEEHDQINKSTHEKTAYEKEKALYAEPNYETVVHQNQPTAQLHVGQTAGEGKESVVTKKVITVTTVTTTNQEEVKK